MRRMASTTRKSKAARADRKSEIEDRLRQAIETLVAEEESFTELSVERLVGEAGMSRSTFYVYFEDKGDLLRAWFGEITAEIEDAARDWWALDAKATRDELRGALAKIVKTYRPHTTLMAAVYDAAA